jgi:hypothetical protein
MRQIMPVAATLAALAGAATAETIRCQSQGYCTLERECFPDSSIMQVEIAPDGSARYGWITEDMYWFEAPVTRRSNSRAWINTSLPDATQTLVITDAGEGAFQITSQFGGEFYASMQVLVCRGK